MNAPGQLDFYAIVLFVHITAAVVAFGITFTYPVIDQVLRKRDPRSLAGLHEAQIHVARRVVTPAAALVLIAGIYLVADRWSELSSGWWSGAFAILIVIVGIEHAVLVPTTKRLRDRAALDVQAAAGSNPGDAGERGEGAEQAILSPEYEQLARQRASFTAVISVLVVIALFLMVVKPGA